MTVKYLNKKAGSSCGVIKNKSVHWVTNDVIAATSKPIIDPSLLPLVTNFIMKAFINGRKLFGTPFYPVPGSEVVRPSWLNQVVQKIQNLNAVCLSVVSPRESVFTICCFCCALLQDYFFDSKVLTDGELAPNDRCCRICGKIGHYMKDCPKRRRFVPSWLIWTFLCVM